MTFIGRTAELSVMEEHYSSRRFELCVMYGRRRVGKTTLVNRFCKDKPTVFFSAVEGSASENLSFLSAAIMEAIPGSIPNSVFATFNDALIQIFELAKHERLVFVVDEYPYLVQSYPAISSQLQHLIDRYQQESQLYIILNGSSMSQMTKEFFTNNRPLYGRKTFQLKLRPFDFFTMRDYFAKTRPQLLPEIYGAFGGTPRYFGFYREDWGFQRNIISSYLSIGASLLEEPDAVLKKEVREPAAYNTIFASIAQGAHKYSELSSKSQLESGNVTGYLDTLVFLDLIRREMPAYTREKKRTLYVIDDNMFRFWYRFVARSLSLINSNRPEIAYRAVEEGLGQYMGAVFEQICLEYLWHVNGRGVLPLDFAEAGRWWGANPITKSDAEIDILAYDGDKHALFAECKWSTTKVNEAVLEEISEKALLPQFARVKQKSVALFSKSGFTKACEQAAGKRDDVLLVSLKEMLDSH